jgi:hypothetical protein
VHLGERGAPSSGVTVVDGRRLEVAQERIMVQGVDERACPADLVPDRHGQAQTVQTPVQTSRAKCAYLQVGSNPVCASS